MAGKPLRPFLLAALALWFGAPTVLACPFCGQQGETLIQVVNQASMVLIGTFTNAQLAANGSGEGTSDFVIDAVIKRHEILDDKTLVKVADKKQVITLPRYVPQQPGQPVKYLVFCDIFKGKVDPYRGVPLAANSDMAKYLTGALAAKDKPVADRLRFAFAYLDNADTEISSDAYKEFANSDYKDYRDMARELPADTVAKWLEDPNTPAFRFGLYASMLGHSGGEKHAAVLRKLLDDPQKRLSSGVDGMLAGYTMLKPKEGWAYTREILKDAKQEFMTRYAALRAARFFWEYREDVVPKNEVVAGVCDLLDDGNIADLAVEDLRKWGRWEVHGKILALAGLKSHDVPIVRRAILRYALSCPEKPCADFVADFRKRDPETVKDTEELLKLENANAPAAVTKTP